jgi:hypothetical protein
MYLRRSVNHRAFTNCVREERQSAFIAIKPLHRLLVLGFFFVYLGVVTVLSLVNQTTGAEWVIPALVIGTIANIAPLIAYKSHYGWFHPLIFGALFSGVGLLRKMPIYAWGLEFNNGLPGYDTHQLSALVSLSLLLAAVAQIAYYFGYFWGPRLPIPYFEYLRPRNLRTKVILVVSCSLALFGLYISQRGGIAAHLLFLGEGRSNLIEQSAFSGEWVLVARLGAIACLIWIAFGSRIRLQPLFWAGAVTALGSLYLAGGSRSEVIYFMMAGVIVWMLREGRVAFSSIVIGSLVSILLIGSLGSVRKATWGGQLDRDLMGDMSVVGLIENGFEELAYRSGALNPIFPILARVPNEIGLLYGRSYVTVLTIPVPRAAWAGKPRSTGVEVGRIFLNTSAPVPPDAIGEAFWNFHVPGVLFVFMCFGVFHRWLVAFFQRNAGRPAILVFYVFTLLAINPSVLAFIQWVQLTVSLGFLLLLFRIISFRVTLSVR